MVNVLEGGKRDNINTSQFAITNYTEDYAVNCNNVIGAGSEGLLELADVVATLIRDLIRLGIIHGTVA